MGALIAGDRRYDAHRSLSPRPEDCSLSLSKLARAAILLGTLALSAPPALADYFRDSIGPDSSATDNTFGLANQFVPPNNGFIIIYEIPAGSGGEVSLLEVVAGAYFGSCVSNTPCYEDMSFRLLGWNNYDEAASGYLAGTIFDVDITGSLSLTRFFGTSDDGIGAPQFPTSLLSFNTGALGAVCPASGCVVGLLVDASATGDVFSIRTSTIGGHVDRQFYVGCAPQGSGTPPMGVRFSVISPSSPRLCQLPRRRRRRPHRLR